MRSRTASRTSANTPSSTGSSPWSPGAPHTPLPKNVQQGLATKWGRNLRGTLLKRINKGWKAGQEKTSRLRLDAAIYGRGKRLVVDQNKLKLIPVKYGGKQVLSTVSRTLGVASGWGTLIAGASLLAQTKKAKKFRADPNAYKKLFNGRRNK